MSEPEYMTTLSPRGDDPAAGHACRSCRSDDLRTFLSLGKMPLPDRLVHPDRLHEPEPHHPLDVAFCSRCSLVQILEDVPPEKLFVDDYLYFSSFSDHLLEHARRHAHGLIASRGLGPDNLVVELASNDGYMLRNFAERGIPVLGVDPAPDQARTARERGIPTIEEFFGAALATRLRAEGRRADVIIANNVMAHVPDLNGFVEGMRILIADDGVITIENPYVRELVQDCEFDTIYHEHFCYFSCTAVDNLMRRHGLFLNHVELFGDLHGGTLRWHVGPTEQRSDAVHEYLRAERDTGMDTFGYYRDFGARVQQVCRDLVALLRDLRAQGRSIAAYGAAAKGSTLVNTAGIGTDLVDFVVDRNVHKQGLCMPGTHLPIRAPAALLDDRPDYVLLLAWNFKDEVMAQQAEYLALGGRFIVPVPTPEIIG
jgi:SAM-dependent methyltransferase